MDGWMRERKTTGGHTTVSLSEMRANSRCELKFICGSLSQVSNPSVILFSDGPAARLLLQKTEAVLADFPEIRVRIVNKRPGVGTTGVAGMERLHTSVIGIYATSRPGSVADLSAWLEPNPLIVIPAARSRASGLRLLQSAAAAGAPTVALGEAGARNAALLAVSMLAANGSKALRDSLDEFRARQTSAVRKTNLPAV